MKKNQTENSSDLYIVSDFHGMSNALSNIEKKLKQGKKIIILGDAIDRGKNGLSMLYRIRQLCNSNPNIIYIPGNHDQMFFAFFYDTLIKCKDASIEDTVKFIIDITQTINNLIINNVETLNRNGQIVTLVSVLNSLDSCRPQSLDNFINLLNWLGDQPILKIVEEDGKRYALGHAGFDITLYKNYQGNFSLKDLATCSDAEYKKASTCLWYKEDKTEYHNILDLPTPEQADEIVVGHTPGKKKVSIIGKNLTRTAICVDGGIFNLKNNILSLQPDELIAYVSRNGNKLTRISFKPNPIPSEHGEK